MSNRKILVPHDFTSVAECAVEHSISLARNMGTEITLLHIVGKADELEDAEDKINAELKKLNAAEKDLRFNGIVRIGNIFDDIGDVATEIHAELIIMGTHGASGFQRLMGSHALRVITHSRTPFVIVQEKGIKATGYDDIVVPLDLHKETKQKLTIVANIARAFKSKVYLVTPNDSDEFLKNTLDRNIHFAKQYLSERDIEFQTDTVDRHDFDQEIIDYAKKVNADLITIMNLQKNSLMGMLGNHFEQNLITNEEEIPVMVVNPAALTVSTGSVLFE